MKNLKITRISSLSKVKSFDDIKQDVRPVLALPGEHVSYQVALETDGYLELSLHVESAIREYYYQFQSFSCCRLPHIDSRAYSRDQAAKRITCHGADIIKPYKQIIRTLFRLE